MAFYKKSKMGHVPGDISIRRKAELLKTDTGYRRDHVKKANRRLRRLAIEEV